jgi:threonine dehydratase
MMSLHDPTLADIHAARRRIADRVHRTPALSSRTLTERLRVPVFLKVETFQKTGSFKARGAVNAVRLLPAEDRARGIVTVSAGNHAQAVAYAAASEGIRCVVVMPAHASASKADATRGFGAEVILHGTVQEAFALFERLQHERGLVPLHPFDDPAVIAGQGTVGLEILEDVPDASLIIVPVGGGGLLSGVAIAVRESGSRARIVGVEPDDSAAMHRARAAGHPVRLERVGSVADGLGAPSVSERTLRIVGGYADDVVLVSDEEILGALRFLLERQKLLVEPAGAAGLAAALARVTMPSRGSLVVVLSGGNVDLARLKTWL